MDETIVSERQHIQGADFSNNTLNFTFGPFIKGERVKSMTMYIVTPLGAVPALSYASLGMRSHFNQPPNTAAVAAGRSLIKRPGGSLVAIPLQFEATPGGVVLTFPVNWRPSKTERYITFTFVDDVGLPASSFLTCAIDVS